MYMAEKIDNLRLQISVIIKYIAAPYRPVLIDSTFGASLKYINHHDHCHNEGKTSFETVTALPNRSFCLILFFFRMDNKL